MNEHDTATIIKWSMIGVGAYVLYNVLKNAYNNVAGAVNVAINAAGAAGSSLADAADFLNSSGIATPGNVYTLTMPDGSVQTLAYGTLPGSGLPAAGTGMQIGTGNSILDSTSQGASGGG